MITTSHQHGKRDEGSTMLVTVMVMVIVASMLLVAAAVYMSEADQTAKGKKSSVAVMAARSGVTAAVTAMRAAKFKDDGTRHLKENEGNATVLPCNQEYAGDLGGSHSSAKYKATVAYYNQDPSNRDKKWLAANRIACSGKALDPTRVVEAKFVLVTSKGTNLGMERTVESVRALAKLDLRDLGGLVRVVRGDVQNLCWTAPPFRSGYNPNAIVTAETCYDKATNLTDTQKESLKERQTWEQRTDNRMMLTFSNDNPAVTPYCMRAAMYRDPSPDSGNPSLTWSNLAGVDWRNVREYRTNQRRFYSMSQWSFMVIRKCRQIEKNSRTTRQNFYTEGGLDYHPVNSGKTGTNRMRAMRTITNLNPRPVMAVPYDRVNDPAKLYDENNRELRVAHHRMEGPVGPGGVDTSRTKVGPGEEKMHSGETKEIKEREFMLVNYRMMGSCLDVEESRIGLQSMIVYPCHVHANISQTSYKNQTFMYSPQKVIYTTMADKRGQGEGPWCMKPEGTGQVGAKVVPYRCDPNRNVPKSSQWVINGMMDDVEKSFTVVNVASGLCMQGAKGRDRAGNPVWLKVNQFTQVVVAKCDGSQLQRWNYQAQISKHGEKMFREVPKGS